METDACSSILVNHLGYSWTPLCTNAYPLEYVCVVSWLHQVTSLDKTPTEFHQSSLSNMSVLNVIGQVLLASYPLRSLPAARKAEGHIPEEPRISQMAYKNDVQEERSAWT